MKRAKKKDVVDPRALWLWGSLLDFQRNGLLDTDPAGVSSTILVI